VEVPILAKVYALSNRHAWRPFLTAGPTVRHTSIDSRYGSTIFSGTSLTNVPGQPFLNSTRTDWSIDPAAGIGVDARLGRFHFDPEVRYSYWRAGTNLYPVRKNQVNLLLGFRF